MNIRALIGLMIYAVAFWAMPLKADRCFIPLFTEEQMARVTEPELASLQDIYSFFEVDYESHHLLNLDEMSQPLGTTFLWHALNEHNAAARVISDLVECPCVKFSRKRCPCLRQWLEEALVQKVEAQYPDKSLPLTYVSIGSGGMFYDLVLLTKLVFAGYKNINIVLVDRIYSDLISRAKAGCYQTEIKMDNCLLQFARWLSFLRVTHDAHPQFTLVLNDVYTQVVADHSADVLVIADLGLKMSEMLEILVRQCFENLLKEHGIYAFLLERLLSGALAETIGEPILHQHLSLDVFEPARGDFVPASSDLTVYVGAKGIRADERTLELPVGYGRVTLGRAIDG